MKRTMLLLALAAVLLLTACALPEQPAIPAPTVQLATDAVNPDTGVLSQQAAYQLMQDGSPVVVVDVRTAEEYAQEHIPGAILIPNEDIADVPPALLPVKSANILLYCRSGNRSAQAAEKLRAMGYRNVYDFGGINDWQYETESGAFSLDEKDGTLSSFLSYDLNGVLRDESLFAEHALTMINIWATFCGPCLREMPALGQLAADYAVRGVQIVGVVLDVTRQPDGTFSALMLDTARELVAQTEADYPHLLPSDDLYAARLNTVFSVPETIFVDSQGNLVADAYVGARSGEDWAEIIDGLLEGRQ